MPNYVSVEGVWKPGKEYVVDPNAEKGKEIYDGLDRQAQLEIQKNGGQMGQHFRLNTEFVMRVKQLGFSSIDEYLKFVGYDEDAAKKKADHLMGIVHDHKPEPRKPATKFEGGGKDMTGNKKNDRFGDFGEPKDAPSEKLQRPQ